MADLGTFPFGQPVREVVQTDRLPRHVFVLGVYASAVHARWVGVDGRTVVTALAVASEPYIFWRGENADDIVQEINIPRELGTLLAAQGKFNGPSGIALDELILGPLGIARADVWLCDLVPHSCMNPTQEKAIKRAYLPVAGEWGLPLPTVPPVPKSMADDARRESILSEILEADAEVLVVLGDQPVRWFLAHYCSRWRRLRAFGTANRTYGRLHFARIGGRELHVLPLAHPRQIAKLGRSSAAWYELHRTWAQEQASRVIGS